jgi:predicted nucleic acid-binding protein
MKPTVYIETSIPSFYHENRTSIAAVARREWTRTWWNTQRSNFEVFTSEAVYSELEKAPKPKQEQCLELLNGIALLQIEEEVATIVETYIAHKIMPQNALGDALHLAITSYYECDYLLTWNCRHIANASKFVHIERINEMLGLFTQRLITPLELLGDNYE